MTQQEKEDRKKLKQINYRLQNIRCCQTCTYKELPYYEDIYCQVAASIEDDIGPEVEHLGICDKYQAESNKRKAKK